VKRRAKPLVSVIIPVLPTEVAWARLLPDLARLPLGSEVILVGPAAPTGRPVPAPTDVLDGTRLRLSFVRSEKGRGRQMNTAAKCARGEFLWFLHADSHVPAQGIDALLTALHTHPNVLHYFDLAFAPDGPPLMALNALGGWFRSRALGLPFGDQGLCLKAKTFATLGGYDEDRRYGEDHDLVWRARKADVSARSVGAPLATSARKYAERGWVPTTAKHLYLTYKQALPEFLELSRRRRLK